MGREISRRQFLLGMGASLVSLVLASCGIKSTKPSATAVDYSKAHCKPEKTAGPTDTPVKATSSPSPTPIGSGLVVAEGTDPESLIQRGLERHRRYRTIC